MARTSFVLVVGSMIAALAFGAGSAKADLFPSLLGGNCGATAAVFSPWGDGRSYYFAPNGGFESGANGWALSGGAQVAAGNEEFSVHGSSESRSLAMPAGSLASISTCYGLLYPNLRFFAKSTNDAPATIHVRIVSRSLLGVLSVLDGGRFTVGTGWSPSPSVSSLGSALAAPVGTKSMQLLISVESGSAQIDDLYVDPLIVKT